MSADLNTKNSAMPKLSAFERRIIRERLKMQRSPVHFFVMKAGKRLNTLILDSIYPAGSKAQALSHARFVTATEKRDTFVAVIIGHNMVQVEGNKK